MPFPPPGDLPDPGSEPTCVSNVSCPGRWVSLQLVPLGKLKVKENHDQITVRATWGRMAGQLTDFGHLQLFEIRAFSFLRKALEVALKHKRIANVLSFSPPSGVQGACAHAIPPPP